MPRVMNELRRVAGHEQFLVVQVPDDVAMNVAGPDDLVDALKRLAKEALNAGQETRTVGDVGEARAGGEVSVLRQKRDGEGSLGRR